MRYYFNGTELGNSCKYCGGDGLKETFDSFGNETGTIECGECDGQGIHLTDEGINLYEFFKRVGSNKWNHLNSVIQLVKNWIEIKVFTMNYMYYSIFTMFVIVAFIAVLNYIEGKE